MRNPMLCTSPHSIQLCAIRFNIGALRSTIRAALRRSTRCAVRAVLRRSTCCAVQLAAPSDTPTLQPRFDDRSIRPIIGSRTVIRSIQHWSTSAQSDVTIARAPIYSDLIRYWRRLIQLITPHANIGASQGCESTPFNYVCACAWALDSVSVSFIHSQSFRNITIQFSILGFFTLILYSVYVLITVCAFLFGSFHFCCI